MTIIYADRVQETFTTTGTGTISLGGAVTGYQAFSAAVANTGTCYYAATDGTSWEVGFGTYATSGNTLARTKILASSNSGAAVSWSAGTKNIWLDRPAVVDGPALMSISGCTLSSIAGTHTTASATVSSGQASDATGAVYLACAGYSWAASNGNAINGTDAASSTLANSSTYHMFLINGPSGTGTFCSASLTPTFPTGYTSFSRRIDGFTTDGSGNPIPHKSIEINGGGIINWLVTQVQDVTNATIGTTIAQQTLASIPTGIKHQPLIRAISTTSGGSIILTSGDETDVAPSSEASPTPVPGQDLAANSSWTSDFAYPILTTNTSAQIGARASGAGTNLYINTRGWIDFRRV